MKRAPSRFQVRLPVMLTGVLPLVFLLAGCGGADDTTSASASLSTSDQLRSAHRTEHAESREGRRSAEGWRRHHGRPDAGTIGHPEGDDDDEHEGDDDEHEGDDDEGTPPTTAPDAGTTRPDAGTTRPDAGSTGTPDSGPTTRPDAGTTPPPDAGTTRPDAGTTTPDAGTTTPDAGTTTPDAGPPASTCINAVTPSSGHHNAGADCLSCHAGMSGANWTLAGTLYSAASGGTAVSGATIEVTDARGTVIRIPTASNGNFYTTQAISFPVHVRASKCPSDVPMNGVAASGSCNSCHNSTFRVHLP